MPAPGPSRAASATRTDWETPEKLFRLIEREGERPFTLDGAANELNTKVSRWYGPGGLVEDAFDAAPVGETIWVNPPYGAGLSRWVELFAAWQRAGNTVVALLPAATDTGWFLHVYRTACDVTFLAGPGRVEFVGGKSGNTGGNLIAFYDGDPHEHAEIHKAELDVWEWKRELDE